ncbi:MAG: UDP-N-acetylmuramoyl-L-alanyl-D-glutamate--2,6-diaminopimelate ligase [Clostridiales bacterium]|nr:UDP-N-acetylmuramoyl-L-alanyl-D-glutamate--2,6-diaminopimelate ligase [Clostridiales bacterium]
MQLCQMLEGLCPEETRGDTCIEIKGITCDSRRVSEGYVFVCIDGTVSDGHIFIPEVITKGACAIVTSKEIPVKLPAEVVFTRFLNTRKALAGLSAAFFGHPSRKFHLIGVTGTKGKTTITYMIKSILEGAGVRTGLIGTIESLAGPERLTEAHRTTPEPGELQETFAKMVEMGMEAVVMEVSSQGLELHRVDFCDFDTGIFTNLTRAHIGDREHNSFEDYFNAKALLFTMCKNNLINIDNEYGRKIAGITKGNLFSYGITSKADYMASDIDKKPDSVEFTLISPVWRNKKIEVNVPGLFTVYNALAAAAVCAVYGIDVEKIAAGLAKVHVPGRVEKVETGKDFSVIIDYAYTPDSLRNILETVRDYAKGRVICLFGCGGDRDRMMRPMMGEIAGEIADFTIITSDNPRSEKPEDIIGMIEEGMKKTNGRYVKITSRKEAIKHALTIARGGDVVLLAGKGHETYQEFNDHTVDFDERIVVKELLKEM